MKKLFHELKTYKGFYLMLILVPILSVAFAIGMIQVSTYLKEARYEENLHYGYASLQAEEYTEAITAFENAYRLENSYDAAVGLAKAWFGSGNAEKAVQILTARSELYEHTDEMDALIEEYNITMGIYPVVVIGGKEITTNTTTIFLDNIPLTQEDKDKLATFTEMVTLDVTNCGLTDIEFLKDCNKLMSVTLTENPISDFTPLYNKPDLRTLFINDTAITDYTQLHALAGITKLNANGNWIKQSDRDALFNALPGCEVIAGLAGYLIVDVNINGTVYSSDVQELNLSGTGLSDITPLKQFSNVSVLNLSDNRLSWITPMEDMTTISTLDLSGNRISNISALSGLYRLSVLNLNDNPITDLSPLAGKTTLTELYVNGGSIYHGHEALTTLTGLTKLHLQNSLLKDQHLALLPMANLTELDIRNNKQLTEAAVSDLAANYPNCTIYSDYTPAE